MVKSLRECKEVFAIVGSLSLVLSFVIFVWAIVTNGNNHTLAGMMFDFTFAVGAFFLMMLVGVTAKEGAFTKMIVLFCALLFPFAVGSIGSKKTPQEHIEMAEYSKRKSKTKKSKPKYEEYGGTHRSRRIVDNDDSWITEPRMGDSLATIKKHHKNVVQQWSTNSQWGTSSSVEADDMVYTIQDGKITAIHDYRNKKIK